MNNEFLGGNMANKLTYTGTLYNNHVERNKEWIETAQNLQEVKLVLKNLKKEEELLLENLKKLSEGVDSRGGAFVFSKGMRKGGIDYKLAAEVENIDFEPYRKEDVEYWKLDVVLALESK